MLMVEQDMISENPLLLLPLLQGYQEEGKKVP